MGRKKRKAIRKSETSFMIRLLLQWLMMEG